MDRRLATREKEKKLILKEEISSSRYAELQVLGPRAVVPAIQDGTLQPNELYSLPQATIERALSSYEKLLRGKYGGHDTGRTISSRGVQTTRLDVIPWENGRPSIGPDKDPREYRALMLDLARGLLYTDSADGTRGIPDVGDGSLTPQMQQELLKMMVLRYGEPADVARLIRDFDLDLNSPDYNEAGSTDSQIIQFLENTNGPTIQALTGVDLSPTALQQTPEVEGLPANRDELRTRYSTDTTAMGETQSRIASIASNIEDPEPLLPNATGNWQRGAVDEPAPPALDPGLAADLDAQLAAQGGPPASAQAPTGAATATVGHDARPVADYGAPPSKGPAGTGGEDTLLVYRGDELVVVRADEATNTDWNNAAKGTDGEVIYNPNPNDLPELEVRTPVASTEVDDAGEYVADARAAVTVDTDFYEDPVGAIANDRVDADGDGRGTTAVPPESAVAPRDDGRDKTVVPPEVAVAPRGDGRGGDADVFAQAQQNLSRTELNRVMRGQTAAARARAMEAAIERAEARREVETMGQSPGFDPGFLGRRTRKRNRAVTRRQEAATRLGELGYTTDTGEVDMVRAGELATADELPERGLDALQALRDYSEANAEVEAYSSPRTRGIMNLGFGRGDHSKDAAEVMKQSMRADAAARRSAAATAHVRSLEDATTRLAAQDTVPDDFEVPTWDEEALGKLQGSLQEPVRESLLINKELLELLVKEELSKLNTITIDAISLDKLVAEEIKKETNNG